LIYFHCQNAWLCWMLHEKMSSLLSRIPRIHIWHSQQGTSASFQVSTEMSIKCWRKLGGWYGGLMWSCSFHRLWMRRVRRLGEGKDVSCTFSFSRFL
jgi:hypothetical protein